EEIDTYENTPTKKVEKKVERASEVAPKSNVTAIKTKERTIRKERPMPSKTMPKQKHLQPVKRNVKTQMVYQYPKGEFRFPLIPDKPVNQPTQSQTQPKRNIRQNTEQPVAKEEVRKRPFAATDVPSPVYAFNKRPSKFEFAVSQVEEIQEELTIPPVDSPEFAEAETIAFDTEIEKQIEETYPDEVGVEEIA
ncbi:DNA translocase FtsK, partial [Listeria grandensis]|nr:DNA translocase FtsK [Listeria grandensis]